MFWLKCCPRCKGDLFEQRDQFGSFFTCIQCGLSRDVPAVKEGPLVINVRPASAPVYLTPSEISRQPTPQRPTSQRQAA